MQYFKSAERMWDGMLEMCIDHGAHFDSREGECMEILGWSGMLLAGAPNIVTNARRRTSATYSGAEMLWYMGMTGDIEMIEHYAPQYPRWANDGVMLGAVGRRMAGTDPRLNKAETLYGRALKLLRTNPNTRQCVMSMWEQYDLQRALDGDCANVPCYTSFQAFIRDYGEGPSLNWITNMRSQDVWLGAPYDIFAFSSIQRTMAADLGIKVGTYTHNVGSLHVYKKHWKQAEDAMSGAHEERETEPLLAIPQSGLDIWRRAITAEKNARSLFEVGEKQIAYKCLESCIESLKALNASCPVADALACAACHMFIENGIKSQGLKYFIGNVADEQMHFNLVNEMERKSNASD